MKFHINDIMHCVLVLKTLFYCRTTLVSAIYVAQHIPIFISNGVTDPGILIYSNIATHQ